MGTHKKPFVFPKPTPPPAPIVLNEIAYFRLRTVLADARAALQVIAQEQLRIQLGVREGMIKVGLDPEQQYVLDDATLTATVQPK